MGRSGQKVRDRGKHFVYRIGVVDDNIKELGDPQRGQSLHKEEAQACLRTPPSDDCVKGAESGGVQF